MNTPRRLYVVAINLLNRPERRKRVIALFAQLQQACSGVFRLQTSILEACDGVTQSMADLNLRYGVVPYSGWVLPESDPESKRLPSWRVPQISGGIASSLSHLDAMNLALDQGWLEPQSPGEPQPILLIAEDDISVFAPTARIFLEQLRDNLDEADRLASWDMLLFGASEPRSDICPPRPLSENLEFSGFSYLTTLDAVTRSGALKYRQARSKIMANCIVFDELHNTMAGLTFAARPDLERVFGGCTPRVMMLTARKNLARQEPKDCVHDTEVSAGDRAGRSAWALPLNTQSRTIQGSEPLHAYRVAVPDRCEVVWWRRAGGLLREDLEISIIGKQEAPAPKQRVSFGFLADQFAGL